MDNNGISSNFFHTAPIKIIFTLFISTWLMLSTPVAMSSTDNGVSQQPGRNDLQRHLTQSHPAQAEKEIVFIDAAVPDQATLLKGINADAEVIHLNSEQDGLQQINWALIGRSGIDAIHVVSHGDEGKLRLGNKTLSLQNIEQYQRELSAIGKTLSAQGDILFYGCRVAAGKTGPALIARMAEVTQADIAASTDMTGPAKQGANWRLEYAMGTIDTPLAFLSERLTTYQHTLVVTPGTINFDFSQSSGAAIPDTNGLRFGNFATDSFGITDSVSGGDDGANVGNVNLITTSASTTQTRIFTIDSSDFKLNSVYIDDYNGVGTVTFHGYRDGAATGDVVPVSVSAGYTLHSINLNNVDEVRLTASNEFSIDDLTVSVAVNATPALSINNASLPYLENDAATQIDAAATLSDADGDAEWNGGTLTVQITTNNKASDEISIPDNVVGSINTTGTSLRNGTTVIGTLDAAEGTVTNGTALTITFNANATNALVTQVVQAIHFYNTSNLPGTNNRVVTFTAIDNGAASASDTRTIAVTAVNDPPTLTATSLDPAFTEGDAAVSLFSTTSVSTIDSGESISQLVLTVTNVNNGVNETLVVDGSSVTLTDATAGTTSGNSYSYSVSVTGTTATVTISGTISAAATQTLVDGLQYHNSANNPDTSNRVVTLTSLKDSGGTANGGVDTTALSVASTVSVSLAANDAPTIGGTPATGVGDDVPYSFTPTANDADGDPITFSIVNKPVWASFNTSDGTLSGTPTSSYIGTTSGIVITVSDGDLSNDLPSFDLEVYADLDNDNIADSVDLDIDGDGTLNASDAFPTDARNSTDSDGDGLADEWEMYHFGNLTAADDTTDTDGDGYSDLAEFTDGQDPTVAEATRNEAQRRIPPTIETLTMPEQMNAGTLYPLDWKMMGYDSSYAVIMAMFDCTGIVDGSCGDSYGDANRFYSIELPAPYLTESAPWSYQGEVADYFHFQTDFTVPATRAGGSDWDTAGTPVVVRFYYKSTEDNDAGKSSLSLLIPGNVTSTYYDASGRRIQKALCPAAGCI